MSLNFIFPGQGAQKVGMGLDIYEKYDSVKKLFDSANEILGRDIKDIIFNGPEDVLKDTRNTQPALFIVEAAFTTLLKEKGLSPKFTLGHSMGEYSALFAAGAFSFEDGLKLVAKRGELMAEAGASTKGGMAAIIGLEKDAIAKVLEGVDGVVVPANENSPEQTVISGDDSAVDIACEKLKEAGAKRAVKLPVSGAFHSPLMQSAADKFEEFLKDVEFSDTECPVITNVTAEPVSDGVALKGLLVKQLLSPVRWVDSMNYLVSNSSTSCVEVGPGAVLKGLGRKCDRSISIVSCNSVDNLYSCLD